jgi:hypothetical protein
MWNQRHGESSSRRKHNRDPKGPAADVPRSGTRDIPLLRPFQAPADTVKNIAEELHSIVTQYTVGSEAAQLHPGPKQQRGSTTQCHHSRYQGGRQEEAGAVPSGDQNYGR